jgi:hypothetical protein
MKPLTKEHIIKNSKPHGMSLNGIAGYKNARQYTETIGEYTLSIVGGCSGLYGDFIIVTEEQLGSIINRLKPINESDITEGSDGNYMAKQQLFMIATLAHKMWEMMEDGEELDDWMESKIAQCDASMTSVVKSYLYDEVEEKQKGMDGLAYDDLVIGT